MATETSVVILGLALGFASLGVSIWAFLDNRRLRSEREKAVIAAHSVIDRTYGLLLGLKPSVSQLGIATQDAVNDGLSAINQARNEISKL